MDAKADFIKFLLILGGLFLLWVFTGGPTRYETAKPLLDQDYGFNSSESN